MLDRLKNLIPDNILSWIRAWPLAAIAIVLAAIVLLADIARLDNLLYGVLKVSLLGYVGYWIDRWLFPYARPHEHWFGVDPPEEIAPAADAESLTHDELQVLSESGYITATPQIRRAIIIAACILTATLIP
jgi:hypothetical protein